MTGERGRWPGDDAGAAVRHLVSSLAKRDTIDHGIGAVMETRSCDAATALRLLVDEATDEDAPVDRVAAAHLASLWP